jgi:Rhodopirellula transposase DDE domain
VPSYTSFALSDQDLADFFDVVVPHLNERQRRLMAGAMARTLGYGGVKAVAEASGLSRKTVQTGARDVDEGVVPSTRVRAPGAGRKPVETVQPGLEDALDGLVEPETRGDPVRSLRWTTKSLRKLSDDLGSQGFTVSPPTVGQLLVASGYSLQAPVKTKEGADHPDRDAQFRYIADLVERFRSAGEPVISVDAKKKELLGDFSPGGREWRPAGQPLEVNTYDFPDEQLGKAVPYGVYDLAENAGWVSVGRSADTAEFAVQTIRSWWYRMGEATYPNATKLLITADGGGSNGYRVRLWKAKLAALASELGVDITVVHFPRGTSKWNKIEHRLFSHITMNWRGRPLESHEVTVNLIAGTTTRTGLTVQAELDQADYQKGIKVTKQEFESIPLERHKFHGEWNYTIRKLADGQTKKSK